MSARDLLANATPRPWILYKGTDHRGSSVPKIARAVVAGAWQRVFQANDPTGADAALIVAAVNEYEALIDIADFAVHKTGCGRLQMVWMTKDGRPPCSCGLQDALARLDAVRSGT